MKKNCFRKNITNPKAYENHLNSKKHKEMVLKVGEEDLGRIKEKAKIVLKKDVVEDEGEENEDEMEMEEVDSDEWEEEEDPIPITDCVFCSHHSANLDNNIK